MATPPPISVTAVQLVFARILEEEGEEAAAAAHLTYPERVYTDTHTHGHTHTGKHTRTLTHGHTAQLVDVCSLLRCADLSTWCR